jgi:hypothetical protein
MRLGNHSEELAQGRLFAYMDSSTKDAGGPGYCRIRTFDGALVELDEIYHRKDGSERAGSPRGYRSSR